MCYLYAKEPEYVKVMSHLAAIDSGNWFVVVQQRACLWHIIALDLQL